MGCFEQTVPRHIMEEFKLHIQMTKETCEIKTCKLKISGNKPLINRYEQPTDTLILRNSFVPVLTALRCASNAEKSAVNNPQKLH